MARRLILLRNRLLPDTIIIPRAAETIFPAPAAAKASWITQFCYYYSTKYSQAPLAKFSDRQCRISDDYTSQGQHDDESVEMKSDDTDVPVENDFGKHVSKKDKVQFLVTTLMDLKDSKEAVYGTLDAWVAWEQRFPIASLRIALTTLEKEQEWHKVIQVIKWILSKGQGNTMGIYRQLINALDMDHRAEEAHNFWMKKIGSDLHPVPWQLCTLMISIYYRNNMLERLVKLFKGLEAFDRKPPDKAVVQKVADAYELLGLIEEKKRVLEKYNSLFTETWRGHPKNSKKKIKKPESNQTRAPHSEQSNTHEAQMPSSDQKITKDEVQVTSCGQQSNMDGMINVVRQMIQT